MYTIFATLHVVVNNPIDYGPYIVAILAVVPGLVVAITALINSRNTQNHVALNTGRILRVENVVNGGLEGHPPAVPTDPVTLQPRE